MIKRETDLPLFGQSYTDSLHSQTPQTTSPSQDSKPKIKPFTSDPRKMTEEKNPKKTKDFTQNTPFKRPEFNPQEFYNELLQKNIEENFEPLFQNFVNDFTQTYQPETQKERNSLNLKIEHFRQKFLQNFKGKFKLMEFYFNKAFKCSEKDEENLRRIEEEMKSPKKLMTRLSLIQNFLEEKKLESEEERKKKLLRKFGENMKREERKILMRNLGVDVERVGDDQQKDEFLKRIKDDRRKRRERDWENLTRAERLVDNLEEQKKTIEPKIDSYLIKLQMKVKALEEKVNEA
jgi:hypothetical protein